MTLAVDVRVELRRRRRATCPLCLRRRVLYALDAYGLVPSPLKLRVGDGPDAEYIGVSGVVSQAVGYGVAMCLECGGLRQPR